MNWFKEVKQKVIDWCLGHQTVSMDRLHQSLDPFEVEILDSEGKVKFIEQSAGNGVFVETPNGMSPIKYSHKTVPYKVWVVLLESGRYLKCADNHIVINDDFEEVYVKDLKPGDFLLTDYGPGVDEVVDVNVSHDMSVNMYDLDVDDDDHVYYTNGILSHNSTVSAAFLLWYAIFNFDKTILIASRANDHAMEMIERIRISYEHLPFWIKPGVRDDGWNKHTLGFDNGSRIMSTATSENSGRGYTISLLYLDEFAFVAPNIQELFWTSISPTLATGGSCIMTSTPNGDMDIFSKIWRGANIPGTDPTSKRGHNDFLPIRVEWTEPPNRDGDFKEKEIAKLGERKWMQEYECIFLSSDALLINSLFLANQTPIMEKIKPINTIKDVNFYGEIRQGGTYLVGVDPATGSGEDYSVLTVFEFPTLNQVAEYRSNTMSTSKLYEVLKNLLLHLEKQHCLVYFSIENNGVGEGVIALYESDENPPDSCELVSEPGKDKRGFTTSARSKMKACVNLKEMYEKEKLHIKSNVLFSELKAYVRSKGSYAAQPGSTDDCISAVLMIIRLVEEIASYDQEAFDKLYTGDFEQWDDETWDGYDGEYDERDEGLPMVF